MSFWYYLRFKSNKWKCDLLHGVICVMKSQILTFADLTKAKLCELLSCKENYCVWRCTNFFRIFPRKYFGWGDCELKFATSKKYPLPMSLVSIDFVEVLGDSLELLLSWITAFELWFSRVRIEFSFVNLPSSILNYCSMVHISMFTFEQQSFFKKEIVISLTSIFYGWICICR